MKKSTYRTASIFAAIILSIAFLNHEIMPVNAQSGTGTLTIPTNFSFQVNLTQGMTLDPDITYLQTVLNSNPKTVVATSGPGSLYQPTASFGGLTKDAVSRFQMLYKSEILTPAGLTSPTGSVGSYTRAKLNSIIHPQTVLTGSGTNYIYTTAQQTVNAPTTVYYGNSAADTMSVATGTNPNTVIDGRGMTKLINISNMHYRVDNSGVRMYALPSFALSNSTNSSTAKPNNQYISNFSTYRAVPLQFMSIFGSGFDLTSNNVYIGPVLIGKYKSSNSSGSQITFSVPDYIPRGFYQIAVSNVFGTTTSQNQYLIIDRASTTEAIIRPVVDSITPAETKNVNDVITVNGSNFTLNNTIMTNLGNLYSIPSYDTKTITFLAGSLPYFGQAQSQYSGKSINQVTKISNENGVSTEVVNHTLTFASKTPTINTTPQNTTGTAEAAKIAELQAFIDARNAASNQVATSSATTTTAQSSAAQPWNGSLNLQIGGGTSSAGGNAGSANSSGGNSGTVNSGGSSNSSIATTLGVGAGAIAAGSLLGGSAGSTAVDKATVPTHFGGTIVQSTLCTCSGGSSLILVDDYASNQILSLMYQPGLSRLNMNFNVYSAGPYVIGGYMPGGGACMVYAGTGCATAGVAQYTIDATRGVGTSAY